MEGMILRSNSRTINEGKVCAARVDGIGGFVFFRRKLPTAKSEGFEYFCLSKVLEKLSFLYAFAWQAKKVRNMFSFYSSFCLNKKNQKFKTKIWSARLKAFYGFLVPLRYTKSLNARFTPLSAPIFIWPRAFTNEV